MLAYTSFRFVTAMGEQEFDYEIERERGIDDKGERVGEESGGGGSSGGSRSGSGSGRGEEGGLVVRVKRSRASRPKVRSGCLVCK